MTRQLYNGVVCDNTVIMRRVAFVGLPKDDFFGMGLKVLKWDDSITSVMNDTELESYKLNRTNWSTVNFKKFNNPDFSNTAPFILGHKYRIHWGQVGIDFEDMTVHVSEEYKPTDESLFFVHNFTDVRAAIDVKYDGGEIIPNNTIPASPADYVTGQNLVLNNTNPDIIME